MATLATLIANARQRADMVGSDFCTDDEFTTWINESLYELYDLLIQKYGNDYFVSTATITADGTSDEFDLPSDMYKMIGLDALETDEYLPVKRFNFAERNFAALTTTVDAARYRLLGDQIQILPRQSSGQVFRLWYIPKLTSMVATTPSDITANTAAGTTLTASITGTSTATGDDAGPHDVVLLLVYHSSSASPYLAVFVDGEFVGDTALSAAPFTVALSTVSAKLTGLTLSVAGSTIVHPVYTYAWSFNTGDPTSYSPTACDPYLEYVSVDVAIKALEKEESSTTELRERKKALKKRIEEAAENRDAGLPATVSDNSASFEEDY